MILRKARNRIRNIRNIDLRKVRNTIRNKRNIDLRKARNTIRNRGNIDLRKAMIESVFLLSLLLHPCAHLSNRAFYQIAFSILPLNSSLSFFILVDKFRFLSFFSIKHEFLHRCIVEAG